MFKVTLCFSPSGPFFNTDVPDLLAGFELYADCIGKLPNKVAVFLTENGEVKVGRKAPGWAGMIKAAKAAEGA